MRSRHFRSGSPDSDAEPLWMRLLAAVLAVPLFEFALFLASRFGSGRGRGSSAAFLLMPAWVHLVYVTLALGVGLVGGFAGLTGLMGHLFLTHKGPERDLRVTAALWAAIALLGLLAGRLAGGR